MQVPRTHTKPDYRIALPLDPNVVVHGSPRVRRAVEKDMWRRRQRADVDDSGLVEG